MYFVVQYLALELGGTLAPGDGGVGTNTFDFVNRVSDLNPKVDRYILTTE